MHHMTQVGQAIPHGQCCALIWFIALATLRFVVALLTDDCKMASRFLHSVAILIIVIFRTLLGLMKITICWILYF